MKAQLLIAAAGRGQRLGMDRPKALAPIGGKALVAVTLEHLRTAPFAEPVIVLYPEGWGEAFAQALGDLASTVLLAPGGVARQDSVRRGLEALDPETDIVAIHDAARPFVPLEAVAAALEAARDHGGATLGTPVSDTILLDDGLGFLNQ